MKKILNVLKGLFIGILIILMFALAMLQQSYRLNPPTQAEREANPFLTSFLAGGE